MNIYQRGKGDFKEAAKRASVAAEGSLEVAERASEAAERASEPAERAEDNGGTKTTRTTRRKKK